MNIQQNVSLKEFSTMGVNAFASEFISIRNIQELIQLAEHLHTYTKPYLIVGGGSNLLFASDYDGLIIKNELVGIEILEESDSSVRLKVASGENWHNLVKYSVNKGWSGIENLALIPGTVGAAPIQNIGAYGVELVDVFYELEAFHLKSGELKTFSKSACQFGYRDSIFKRELKDEYVILSITIELQKEGIPNVSYHALSAHLSNKDIKVPTISDVFNAVIEVRQSKLPDPAVIGNNGSFFKNPVIPVFHFDELRRKYEDLPSYPVTEHLVKVPAGWLIEKAGWKGFRKGDAGVHEKQALVLVNYGNATGTEIFELSKSIQSDIEAKYGITLHREVNVIGHS